MTEGAAMGKTDKIKNTAQQATGKAKEWAGEVTDNENLEQAGRQEQARAKARKAGEDVKDAGKDVKDTMKDVKDTMK
jgi:uncharacterized protein YjbJ (UPF0337 family)